MGQEKKNSHSNKPKYQYINTFPDLQAFIAEIESEKILAVDLEADSMFHFKEKICLIQMSTQNQSAVIDPLFIKDLSPLKPIFHNPAIKKIFHGADYDIRSLYRDFKIDINNLFDTQLASMFLGIRETSLEAVCKARFNIKLDKKYQKKDWSIRPLPTPMVDYAAGDTKYLISLYTELTKELSAAKRDFWVIEECEYLSRVRSTNADNTPLFLKCRGAGRLDRQSLAVLENLLQLRKTIAEKKDRPLFKVLSNSSLINIATSMPLRLSELKKLNIISHKQQNMYGKSLIKAIIPALKIPRENLPLYPRKKKSVSVKASSRIKALKKCRDQLSEQFMLDPGLLLNKSLICTLAEKNPYNLDELKKIPEIKNWQYKVFGTEIVKTLKTLPI